MGEKKVNNPPDLWIRGEGCLEPMIQRETFLQAKKVITERRVDLPEPEMLLRLRKTFAKRGKLSPAIISETPGLPCTATYMQHFGTLREAYRLVGYAPRRNYDYLDFRLRWADLKFQLASQVAARITKAGEAPSFNRKKDGLRVNERESISFRFARWHPGQKENHAPYWSVERRVILPAGWVIAIRLTERNKDVLDYLLIPTIKIVFKLLRFSEKSRIRRGIQNFKTFDGLLRSLTRRITMPGRAVSARPRLATRSPAKGRHETKSGRARR